MEKCGPLCAPKEEFVRCHSCPEVAKDRYFVVMVSDIGECRMWFCDDICRSGFVKRAIKAPNSFSDLDSLVKVVLPLLESSTSVQIQAFFSGILEDRCKLCFVGNARCNCE